MNNDDPVLEAALAAKMKWLEKELSNV